MFLDLILPFNSIEIALNFGANEEANLRVDKGQIYASAEILDKMAAALAHFVHNGVQII